MAIYPGAVWRPMPWQASLPARVDVAQAILHTNGGGTDNGSLYGWFSRAANTQHIASHYQVASSGGVEQYEDTTRQAFAQYAGNKTGISIETEDDGNPATPWTDAQLASILAVLRFHHIPAQVAQPTGPGVGWHCLYGQWNLSGHSCPGPVRIAQIRTQIIPALAGEETDVPLTAADLTAINGVVIGVVRSAEFHAIVAKIVADQLAALPPGSTIAPAAVETAIRSALKSIGETP